MQQFRPLESLLVSPLRVSTQLWGPMGSGGCEASYAPPWPSHGPAHKHSRTAQCAFTAWKGKSPPCGLTGLLAALGKTCLWQFAADKVTLMPLAPGAQEKHKLPHPPHLQCPPGQGTALLPCSQRPAEAGRGVRVFSGSNFLVTLTKGIISPERSEVFRVPRKSSHLSCHTASLLTAPHLSPLTLYPSPGRRREPGVSAHPRQKFP